ncbi:MAG: aminotransferase class III-fold pyridoxal phosphate-dependent enzyme [Alphaproteobacteria bacterium]|nr:aminotransferase class III-fold pyridoxal phosphate-dependent enzyme [Alphaproteobacteria bacterium]MBU0794988.1 aminotransferase class III-fold pyridoxal phosphate-dependent enzyme [Alphaproteobacteria bacterium]MBU0876646.1 aminotransferase class III-fold pyridoxal phosphate-dependent enzyme [Alphaproteobacteria bacterium]MBU1769348.1 aminotransferase class III-fold pyridoxal phosphate-dependent enzyme [Alphaproteobacteria bacterium]
MASQLSDEALRDQRSQFHPFTSLTDLMADGPTVMTSGDGIRVRDVDGNEYIDGMAGLWCVNLGYGRREIVDAIAKQSERLSFFHTFNGMTTDVVAQCAEALLARAPVPMSRVFFGASGSDANETQLKLVWYYNNLRGKPEKKKVIARWNAYHGSGVATASLTGLPGMHTLFDLPKGPILHVSAPYYYRNAPDGMSERDFSRQLAKELEDVIEREGGETIAAFFAEAVMGAGGLIPPPEGYFDEIMPILKKHDILLVADEVVSGFGRLGTYWGSQSYGFEPDLITSAKGVTSGYFPMSVCFISPKVWNVIESEAAKAGLFGHGYTYSAHPVGAAAALAALKLIDDLNVVGNVADVGPYMLGALKDRLGQHAHVGDIRGKGLMLGIELMKDRGSKETFPMADRTGRQVLKAAAKRGLITRALGDTLVFAPPLIITRGDADEIVDRFAASVEDVLGTK